MRVIIVLKNGQSIKDDIQIESLEEIGKNIDKYKWVHTSKSLIKVSEISHIIEVR